MHNAKYSTPSYETPCLVRVKDFGWIEAELCLEEDTGNMYFPLCGSNVIKYEVWYSQVSESFYSAEYSKGTLQEYVDNLGRGRG